MGKSATTDYILNGQGYGDVAEVLAEHEWDLRTLRPCKAHGGKARGSYTTLTNEETGEVYNAYSPNPATLFKEEWVAVDETVLRVQTSVLSAWSDLMSMSTPYNLNNGFMQTILQHQTMSQAGGVAVDMDGLSEAKGDRPIVDLRGIPLPIIHADFRFSARDLAISRRSGNPIDMTMIEECTLRISEQLEDMTIGNADVFSYGGFSIPGYTNFADRISYTITSPVSGGWTPQVIVDELADMKEQARLNGNFRGPFVAYFGTAWERFLDGDFSAAYPNLTLKERIQKLQNIGSVRMLDNLSGYQVLLVEMRARTARPIVGMPMTTVNWPSNGGMMRNFKILCILVPQLRSDFNNNAGVVHGNV